MYYGTDIYTKEKLYCDRRDLTNCTNRLICSIEVSESRYLMKQEMQSILKSGKDKVIIFTFYAKAYKDLINKAKGKMIETNNASEIFDGIVNSTERFICVSLSDPIDIQIEDYVGCLDAVKNALPHLRREGETTWLYLEDNSVFYFTSPMRVVDDIVKSARTSGCTVTISSHNFSTLKDMCEKCSLGILENMPFVTLLHLVTFSREAAVSTYTGCFDKNSVSRLFDTEGEPKTGVILLPNEEKFRVFSYNIADSKQSYYEYEYKPKERSGFVLGKSGKAKKVNQYD